MGVSKESISKFLIGNRFHVKLRILSPYSNRRNTNSILAYTRRGKYILKQTKNCAWQLVLSVGGRTVRQFFRGCHVGGVSMCGAGRKSRGNNEGLCARGDSQERDDADARTCRAASPFARQPRLSRHMAFVSELQLWKRFRVAISRTGTAALFGPHVGRAGLRANGGFQKFINRFVTTRCRLTRRQHVTVVALLRNSNTVTAATRVTSDLKSLVASVVLTWSYWH